MIQLLGLPGWACSQNLHSWLGREMKTLNHLNQAPILLGKSSPAELIPKKPWALLSWSMGSWTALKMSAHWQHNPPLYWLALAPFYRLTAKNLSVTPESHQQLLKAYHLNPRRTMKFFALKNGSQKKWFDSEALSEKDLECLGQTLALFADGEKGLPTHVDIPCHIAYGAKDTLLSNKNIGDFKSLFTDVSVQVLESKDHALFYEQPPELEATLKHLESQYVPV